MVWFLRWGIRFSFFRKPRWSFIRYGYQSQIIPKLQWRGTLTVIRSFTKNRSHITVRVAREAYASSLSFLSKRICVTFSIGCVSIFTIPSNSSLRSTMNGVGRAKMLPPCISWAYCRGFVIQMWIISAPMRSMLIPKSNSLEALATAIYFLLTSSHGCW